MSETLESVAQRLAAVERELAVVRERLRLLTPGEEMPADHNVPMLREARANQAALAVTAQEVFAALGISGEPVEAEAAQRQMLSEGVRAEDNTFSRDLIDMRDE